jgi:perosamine synthetase
MGKNLLLQQRIYLMNMGESPLKTILQYEPLITQAEKDSVNAYMDSGGWLTEFQKTKEFAKQISDFTGSKYSSILSNGTVTLTAALVAYGISKDDEVIVPDFTMVASANAALILGCKVVFVDIEKETFCMSYDSLIEKVTPATKAIILVSINGRYPTKVEEIIKFCKQRQIIVIEDAAQSLGSFYKNQHIGTFGDIASFSFSMPKIITTGQGGALITNDSEIASRIREIRDFGREKPGADHYLSIGWNFKFTDLQAVIGIEQMKQLDERINKKRQLYQLYENNLRKTKGIKFIPTNLSETTPWFVDVLVEKRNELMLYLKSKGIITRKFYPSLHSEPAFDGYIGNFENTDYVTSRGLWLPSSLTLTDDEILYVCNSIKEFYS